ncbi:MAG: hypothetical protein WCS33_00740 [Candidatus Caldatribacteriota bacterium]
MGKKFYIGLDQSSRKTGYALLDEEGKLILYGVFNITGENAIQRSNKLIKEFLATFWDYLTKETIVGLEDIKGNQINYKTTITLAKVLGAIEYFFDTKDIKYEVIPPGTWRKTCGIKGRKREEQKINAIAKVKEKYGVEAKEDAAEAICIAEHLYMQAGW